MAQFDVDLVVFGWYIDTMKTKKCTKCHRSIKEEDFGSNRFWCRQCRTEATKDWRKRHLEEVNRKARERYARQDDPPCKRYRRELRESVLRHYGNRCACCGEARVEFLCVDHINGGGTQHRKQLGRKSVYAWIKQNGFPVGFRVLCWNCNSSLGLYGYSPADKDFL